MAPAARSSGGRGRRRSRPAGPSEPVPGGAADLTPDADPDAVARAIVLRQLTMAPRSRAQLADKLAQRGADEAVAERVLDRFEEVGLIDDTAFAEVLVRSQRAGRGLARRALAQELRRKGVDDDIARSTLADIDDDSERGLARGLVQRRLRSLRGVPPDKQVSRLVGMLARKGYPGGVALSVVREVLDDDARAVLDDGYDPSAG